MAFNEECAVFAAWGDSQAAYSTYLGLYAQQHRGQESCGIVSVHPESGQHVIRKGLGLVSEVFDERSLSHLKGSVSIGHARYSTTGKNLLNNTQPLTAQLLSESFALAHNGNLLNAKDLKVSLQKKGAIFQGTNDTECLLHLVAQNSHQDLKTRIRESLPLLRGAFSMVLLAGEELVAARDPLGYRPLVLGKRVKGGEGVSYYLSSETCAFDLIGAEYVRDIEPGEMIWINEEGVHSEFFGKREGKKAQCVFEHVYFARPDSMVFGRSVYESRKQMGASLAKEKPVEADIVIPVPDSGVPAAIGYAQESGLPFELGIIRNHYIGRTFIQPGSSLRKMGVKIKLNPQSSILKGKRVVVIDDSLVRGTTSQKIIRLVRQAGAKEVHFCIASPPTVSPCYYGVDTPEKEQLIASFKSREEIEKFIGADSLTYLSYDSLFQSVKGSKETHCAACFTGDYPET